ncbi:MAG: hypothetical protein ACK4NC_03320 [Candidatus Gracilibacteria bacterium]
MFATPEVFSCIRCGKDFKPDALKSGDYGIKAKKLGLVCQYGHVDPIYSELASVFVICTEGDPKRVLFTESKTGLRLPYSSTVKDEDIGHDVEIITAQKVISKTHINEILGGIIARGLVCYSANKLYQVTVEERPLKSSNFAWYNVNDLLREDPSLTIVTPSERVVIKTLFSK